MNPLVLLDACEDAMHSVAFSAGPHNRDGVSVKTIGGETVLIFRGTMVHGAVAFLDWMNDLRVDLVRRPEYPGWVHRGWADSLSDLWGWISGNQLPKGLWITGHSKGGALAMLCGHLLRDLRPNVLTFASPKVGDSTFAAAYDAACIRYTSPFDIVPMFPPFGYDVVGTEIRPPSSWMPPPHFDVIDQHHLATYRQWVGGDDKQAQAIALSAA